MHLVRGALITVADLDRAVARYGEWLDYELVERDSVTAELAALWDAPKCEGAAMAVMRPASGAECFLRFVEQPPHPDYAPLRSFGWAAVELTVQDTDAVHARLQGSPFEIIGPPKELDGMSNIYPMQVRGPDGEIVYLTQIREQPEDYRLVQAKSLVDQIFILVLACRDLEATGAWMEAALGLSKGKTMEIVYSMINTSFGLDADTKHPLATLKHGDDVFLEIDTYPDGATARPAHHGWLPPGVAMASFAHPGYASLVGDTGIRPDGPVYAGGRATLLRGPDGARFELIEIP